MKRTARDLEVLGSISVLDPELSQQIEQSLAEVEDARAEAAAAAAERDALAEALNQSRIEVHQRDGELAALRARLAKTEALLEAKEIAGSATAEELSVAMEELQASAVSLEEANDSLIRINNELERRVAERTAALAESETRLRAATDAVPHLVWTSAPGGSWTWANRRWVEYTGLGVSKSVGLGWLDRVHPDDRDATMAAWRNADAAGELRIEHRLRAAEGGYRWFSTRALPARKVPARRPNADGEEEETRATWYGTSTDVEDARRTETALRESEARFRGFAETSPDVLWIVDATGQRLEYLSPAYEQVWGETRRAVLNDIRHWAELLHPDDLHTLDILPRVLRGERAEAEYRIRRASDGAVRWIRDTGFPILDASGQVQRVAGLAQDVTSQREAEQQQKLLLNELNHRVKNALAGAQALAAQTARGGGVSDNPGAFLRAFEERLIALARAHDMLTREGWRSASLGEVVAETLAPHNGDAGRVQASGPEVRLVPGAAVALHMAFHELATNALKHGALSAASGRVEVAWSILRPANDAPELPAILDIVWRECGGPPVEGPPARTGFGMRLLEKGLARQLGGEARFAFAPSGLEFGLRLPLSSRVEAR
jgi:PAS domain S-box-containing protein